MKKLILLFISCLCFASAQDNPKVLLFLNGVLGDKSFFDSAQRGMNLLENELGLETQTIEAGIDGTQWEAALIDALENEDFDIMVLGTFDMVSYLERYAPLYPDKKFIIFDAPVNYEACGCDNVYSLLFKQNEGGYLAGVYAAAMTTSALEGMNDSAIIGALGGQEIPVIVDFMVGYEQGAKTINPDITVLRQFAGSWIDPAKGKDIANAQYNQGADIVFQIAGGTGQGVFEAAYEQGHYAIGVDSDQATIIADSDPEQAQHILTSVLKNVDQGVLRALTRHLEGTLPYGQLEALGVAEGGVGLAINDIYNAATPDEVKAAVQTAIDSILDGSTVVDSAF